MHTLDGATRGVVHSPKGGIPFQGDGGTAGYAGLAGYALGSAVAGEVLGEDGPVEILLFVFRGIDGEAFGSVGQLLVGDSGSGDGTLRSWQSRGHIVYDEASGRYCKTEEYKKKFQVS